MIKVKEGKFKFKGNKSELMADLTSVLEVLEIDKKLTRKDIDECIKLSRVPVEEKIDMLFKKLGEAVFGIGEGDEDGE